MIKVDQVKEILTGWGNVFLNEFNSLNPNTKAEAERRLKICESCPVRSGRVCSKMKEGNNVITNQLTVGCGCNLRAKAASPASKCPLGKW